MRLITATGDSLEKTGSEDCGKSETMRGKSREMGHVYWLDLEIERILAILMLSEVIF